MRKLSLLLVLVMASVSFGAFLPAGIPEGTVTVDGILTSDWSGATWTAMDTIVYGSAQDGNPGDGQMAMQWNDAANLVYLAVQFTDTDRNYTTIGVPGSWRAMDMVEVFWDGANNDSTTYTASNALAQHYMITGPATGIDAAVHFQDYGVAAASDYGGAKWVITGDTVVLEIGLKPWTYRPTASHDLALNGIVGLDAIINDRDEVANDNQHGWWAHEGVVNGSVGISSSNSAVFTNSTLVPEPCTMLLLGLGGLGLIRRKK